MKVLFSRFVAASILVMVVGACGASPDEGGGDVKVVPVNPVEDIDMEFLINAARLSTGRPPVEPSPLLDAAARSHAVDMIRRDYFSHTSPESGTVLDRVKAQGYSACHVSEVLAWGHSTKIEAMQAWMNSKKHRGSILSERSKEFGVAGMKQVEPETDRGSVWVVVFAEPGC